MGLIWIGSCRRDGGDSAEKNEAGQDNINSLAKNASLFCIEDGRWSYVFQHGYFASRFDVVTQFLEELNPHALSVNQK